MNKSKFHLCSNCAHVCMYPTHPHSLSPHPHPHTPTTPHHTQHSDPTMIALTISTLFLCTRMSHTHIHVYIRTSTTHTTHYFGTVPRWYSANSFSCRSLRETRCSTEEGRFTLCWLALRILAAMKFFYMQTIRNTNMQYR